MKAIKFFNSWKLIDKIEQSGRAEVVVCEMSFSAAKDLDQSLIKLQMRNAMRAFSVNAEGKEILTVKN